MSENKKKIKISYDYEHLIEEIEEEIAEGSLTFEDIVQVLRSNRSIDDNYFPVIDWYYCDATMNKIVLEDSFETEQIKKDYEKNKDSLQPIKVKDLLVEMNFYNEII